MLHVSLCRPLGPAVALCILMGPGRNIGSNFMLRGGGVALVAAGMLPKNERHRKCHTTVADIGYPRQR